MTDKIDVRIQIESYDLVKDDCQLRRNLKAAIEKDLPAYRCAIKTVKHLGGSR